MSVTNDFLPFCPTDTGTNLESQSDYLVDSDRTTGNQPGIASSQLNNKALRQGTYVASQLAQFIANQSNTSAVDNATPAQFLAQITSVMQYISPKITALLSGTGTFLPTYVFYLASANATVGATYSNNSNTFTVSSTISSGSILFTTGNGAPTVSGTLTKTGGTGDSTITFYAVRSSLYLYVKAAGAGGGAGGGGAGGGDGTAGTATTFGSSLITCNGGGVGGGGGDPAGFGGSATLGASAKGLALNGGDGTASDQITGTPATGGIGGSSAFGGAGQGTTSANVGGSGYANTGGGGGGSGSPSGTNQVGGSGGGAGGYCEAYVPSASYAYSIGVGGTGGSAGTGDVGGNGGSGVVLIEECFQ